MLEVPRGRGVQAGCRRPDAQRLRRAPRPTRRQGVADRPGRTRLDRLTAEANAIRARRIELATEFADGELTAAELRAARERLNTKLDAIESKMSDAAVKRVFADIPLRDRPGGRGVRTSRRRPAARGYQRDVDRYRHAGRQGSPPPRRGAVRPRANRDRVEALAVDVGTPTIEVYCANPRHARGGYRRPSASSPTTGLGWVGLFKSARPHARGGDTPSSMRNGAERRRPAYRPEGPPGAICRTQSLCGAACVACRTVGTCSC